MAYVVALFVAQSPDTSVVTQSTTVLQYHTIVQTVTTFSRFCIFLKSAVTLKVRPVAQPVPGSTAFLPVVGDTYGDKKANS
jgi:hypothetical protein